MLKKKKLQFLSMALIMCLGSLSLPEVASAKELPSNTNTKSISYSTQSPIQFKPSASAIKFTNTMISSGLIKEFAFDEKGNLILKHSLSDVKKKYNLDDSYIKSLQKVLDNGQKRNTISSTPDPLGLNDSKISVSNWKVYLTNDDVRCYLFAAAAEGPVAMDAALEALGTLTGGPAGTVVATILSIAGTASIANLCYLCLQAINDDKGIYIGIAWNGNYPNYTEGEW